MKKMLKGIIVTVAILSMGMTTLAVDSPTSGAVVSGVVEGASVDDNGRTVEVVVEAVEEELYAEIAYILEAEALEELLGDTFTEGMEVVEIREVSIIGDYNDVSWPVTIVFDVEGVYANTEVQVLHYDKGAWEIVESVAGAGTITATFHSLSPVAFVIGDTVVSDSSTGTTDTSTSPNTGEIGVIFAALAAGAAGATAYTVRKKKAK